MKRFLVCVFIFSLCGFFSCTPKNNAQEEAPQLIETQIAANEDFYNVKYVAAREGLRVRSTPSLDGERIGLLEFGKQVIIIEEKNAPVNIDGVSGKWVFIRTPVEGWIFSGFLSDAPLPGGIVYHYPDSLEFDVSSNFAHYADDDMIPNVRVVYRPESGIIEDVQNLDDAIVVKPLLAREVFEKPILNKDVKIVSRFSPAFLELIQPFEITLTDEQLADIHNASSMSAQDEYRYAQNLLSFDTLKLSFYRDWSAFTVNYIEYEKNSTFYDFNVKIGTSREKIIERFGAPPYYSQVRDIYVYNVIGWREQMNITFKNDAVAKVQLIVFDAE